MAVTLIVFVACAFIGTGIYAYVVRPVLRAVGVI